MKLNLKKLREQKGVDTKFMAEKFGISLRTYQNYENGSTEMPFALLTNFADFFNCSIDYLLGHQTKDLIYVSGLTPQQLTLINQIQELSDDKLLIVEGFIRGLKYK